MIPMRDSKVPADWLAAAMAASPIQLLSDGTYTTCPVRLDFPNLLEPQDKRKNDEGEERDGNYGALLLFPDGAKEQIDKVLYPAWYYMCKSKFSDRFEADGTYWGLHWPFHDCKISQKYMGHTPGLLKLATSSQFKILVVDTMRNVIADKRRIYRGVWGICQLRPYAYSNKKTGCGFGLGTVMLIADDQQLGGGAPDPNKVFAGVTVQANYDPATIFGSPAAGATPSALPPPPGSAGAGGPPSSFAPPPYAPAPAQAGGELDWDPTQ